MLTRNLDSADILKNVYFDFVFCLKNPSVDIDDLLSPGDPHNCTYFDIYTHLGRGVPVYHYACRLRVKARYIWIEEQ